MGRIYEVEFKAVSSVLIEANDADEAEDIFYEMTRNDLDEIHGEISSDDIEVVYTEEFEEAKIV